MPTQKTFKRRVRTRMAKTGESYTAAREQLLRKARPSVGEPNSESQPTPEAQATMVSAEAMRRASGKAHDEWFALLDAWSASERRHPEIAEWLRSEHGVAAWWSQQITVEYERARGLRAPHQMTDGYTVGVNRTVAAEPSRLLEAFTDGSVRERWLPGAPIRQRPTRAALTARFDWADPPSRLVVAVTPRGESKGTISIAHEKLRDADSAERLKAAWRDWLDGLKEFVERD